MDLPERNDVVVCKISKILNYGVFVELVEFDNLQGFVHISEVSSSWVKNIRNFVKENQVRAAKVLRLNHDKNQIDLSFTRVNPREQRKRIDDWRQLKRCQKLLEQMAKQNKAEPDIVWKEVAEPLLDEYNSLYESFQEILSKGESAAVNVDKKWLKPLLKMVKENIQLPERTLKGVLTISSFEPNGVEIIKGALVAARKSVKGVNAEIIYNGSGKYNIKVISDDFKKAEKAVSQLSEKAIELIEASKGKASFEKIAA